MEITEKEPILLFDDSVIVDGYLNDDIFQQIININRNNHLCIKKIVDGVINKVNKLTIFTENNVKLLNEKLDQVLTYNKNIIDKFVDRKERFEEDEKQLVIILVVKRCIWATWTSSEEKSVQQLLNTIQDKPYSEASKLLSKSHFEIKKRKICPMNQCTRIRNSVEFFNEPVQEILLERKY